MDEVDDDSLDAPVPPKVQSRQTLTNSSIGCYQSCPYKYWLMYELGLRKEREADYFRLGTMYHLGMEMLGNGKTLADVQVAINENYANPPAWCDTEELLNAWWYEAVTVITLIRGWVWRWGNEPLGEVVSAEETFLVPIRNPETGRTSRNFHRAGKKDQIVRLHDGRLALWEFKTTSQDVSPGSDYRFRLRYDNQASGYVLACRMAGHMVETVYFDVCRKPTIKPTMVPVLDADGLKIVVDAYGNRVRTKKGDKWRETGDTAEGYVLKTRPMTLDEWRAKLWASIEEQPDRYYQRFEVPRSDGDIQRYEKDLWIKQKRIRDSQRMGTWDRNDKSCIVNNSKCEYFGLCANDVDVTKQIPEGYRVSEMIHEELTETEIE